MHTFVRLCHIPPGSNMRVTYRDVVHIGIFWDILFYMDIFVTYIDFRVLAM